MPIDDRSPVATQGDQATASRINDRGLFWGLIALLCWAPLPIGSNRSWSMAILMAWSQVLLFCAIILWRSYPDGAMARLRQFRWPIGLLGAFIGLLWVQLLPLPAGILGFLSPETLAVAQSVGRFTLSLDPSASERYFMLGFAYFSTFLVTLLTVRDARRIDQLAAALVFNGLFHASLGIALFSAGATYRIFFTDIFHTRVIGSYVYHNHFAGYMEICLSVGIGLMLARLGSQSSRPGNWRHKATSALAFILSPKMRLRIMLIVMVIALVLTRSRMGNTSFFAAMLLVGLTSLLLSRRMAPATVGLILSLIIIDIAVIGTWVGLEKVVARIQETTLQSAASSQEESIEQRLDVSHHALELIRDFPAFGTGGGSFYNTYLRYKNPSIPVYFDHAHNDYVELAADNGLIGIGLLGAFVLLSAGSTLHILLRRRASLPRGIAFGTLMMIVTLLIHSSVDFNLQLPANALTIVVVIAMGWCAWSLPSQSRNDSRHNAPNESKDSAATR